MSEIPVSYFTPEECSSAASQAFPLIENKFQNDPLISVISPIIKENADNLSLSMTVSGSSEYTAKIDAADGEFDSSFVSFRDYAFATAGLKKKTERVEPAKKVCNVIEKHGKDLYRMGKNEQIGQMNSLAAELGTPEMQKTLEDADLKDSFDDVQEKHNALLGLMGLRTNAENTVNNLPPPGEAKKPLAENLQDLSNYFTVLGKYVDSYKETASKIDTIFGGIAAVARARHSRTISNGKAKKAGADVDGKEAEAMITSISEKTQG